MAKNRSSSDKSARRAQNRAAIIRANKKLMSPEAYVKGIKSNDRVMLGKAITLIESELAKHREIAREVINQCLPTNNQSLRIGITGTPGVGKSTFIEALGKEVLASGKKLAVLAIDPSSQMTKGSILGDKTRMSNLSTDSRVFIRPSPAGESLGGVARHTRETIILCEAAGYDVIFVETVGVGQSEIAVHSMTDCFLLLLLPGAGDELQGIKRGIVEMADLLAINKSDGDRIALAKQTRKAYNNALHLMPPKPNAWPVKSHLCSALHGDGIVEVWEAIKKLITHNREGDFFISKRKDQAQYWLRESVNDQLWHLLKTNPTLQAFQKEIEAKVNADEISPFDGADLLLQKIIKST